MPDLSLETIPILLAFIVPGFVWAKVHGALQVSRPGSGDTWLAIFTLSAVNYSIWFWLIPVLMAGTFDVVRGESEGWTLLSIGWLDVTFLSPALLGILTGFAYRQSWLRNVLLDRLRLNIPHPIETAWESVFAERGPLWATVTLTDGTVVEGIYGSNSRASTRPDERDLYLEVVYERRGEELGMAENSAGVWFAPGTVKTIMFRELVTASGGHG